MLKQNEKIESIKRICEIVLHLLEDERKAIVTGSWGRLDAQIRRKANLLRKLEQTGLETLNSLYIFDKRVVEIRNLIQQIVDTENENAQLLKIQMQDIKDNLSNLKNVLKLALYGTSEKSTQGLMHT